MLTLYNEQAFLSGHTTYDKNQTYALDKFDTVVPCFLLDKTLLYVYREKKLSQSQ
ncbi:TPA: hypothetical protein PF089_001465 [Staphylococcus aureus]|nr:hypothetical protein [Staphylococcus aureus]HDG5398687.1 hypothetical protein [Staphylococcus aureus]